MPGVRAALAALLLVGAALWQSALRRRRKRAGLPEGRVVATDSQPEPGRTLVARGIRLRGRPAVLIRRGTAIIPAGAHAGRPDPGHVLPPLAYRPLVEEHDSVRPTCGPRRSPAAARALRAVGAGIRRPSGPTPSVRPIRG